MIESLFQVASLFFDPVLIFATGLLGGFISGFLGIGCGIIIMPILIEFGIPPLTAIATQLCHAVGTNMINFLTYKRKNAVDFHLASYMLFGGILGAMCEWIILKKYSKPEVIFNKFVYVYISILVIIGFVMLCQSISGWKNVPVKKYPKNVLIRRWMLYLPFHKIFTRSRAEMSIIIPIFVGFLAGVLVASLGGGSNLFMAPIITYLIGRISPVVNGTIALVGCFIAVVITVIYILNGYYCDISFVLLLFAGAAFGSWVGVRLTYKVKRYQIHAVAVVVVFLMASRQVFKLANHSFFTSGVNTKSSSLESILSVFMKEEPTTYAILCISLIIIIAYSYEKYLHKIHKIRKRAKKMRQRND